MGNQSNKKITIAAGSFWPEIGGPSSYIKTITPRLIDAGFDVDLIARSKKKNYPEDSEIGWMIHRIKNLPGKPLNYFRYFLKLLKVAKSSDLIYAQGSVSSGYPAFWANKFLKKKFVVKITGDYAWEQYSLKNELIDVLGFQNKKISGRPNLLRKIQEKVLTATDTVIVPSRFLAKVVKYWGVKPEKIKVIYNGTNFKPLKIEKEKARREIGISGNIILSAGRLVPWKGFRMLIKMMPEFLSEDQFSRLVIIGNGPEMENLELMKSNLGLNGKVHLVGKKSQEELKTYLAAADLFVLNTAYEGFSHQILEAMASGVPVITTNVGGNPEVIKQGENGFMVKYNDELNLIEAIKGLFNHRNIREKFIKEGKKTARKFTVQKMTDETVETLNSLIKNA